MMKNVSLVTEDSMNYIRLQNPDRKIRADIQIKRYEDGVQITTIDNCEIRAFRPA